MANITPQITREHGRVTVLWETMLDDDEGLKFDSPVGYNNRTVQVTGTFGSGGTVAIEGTLDGTNWFELTDFTAAGGVGIVNPLKGIRPHVTAGDGTTDLDVTIVFTVD